MISFIRGIPKHSQVWKEKSTPIQEIFKEEIDLRGKMEMWQLNKRPQAFQEDREHRGGKILIPSSSVCVGIPRPHPS